MKRKVLLFCIGLLVIIIMACSSKVDEPDTVYYNISDLPKEGSNNTSDHTYIGDIVQPTEDASSIVNKEAPTDYVLVTEIEFWTYLKDFQGITSEYDKPIPANLEINQKHDLYALGLVCPDPNSDIIYYVNYGSDDYIYQLEGNHSTLILDKKACFLNLYNDNLYFLSDEIKGVVNRDKPKSIYRYNLTTKELFLVVDAKAHSLYVNSNGIFYTAFDSGLKGYQLTFDSDTPVELDTFYYPQYKGYMLEDRLEGIVLRNQISGDEILVMPSSFQIMETIFVIDGDILYFSYADKLYSLNLASGDKVIYDLGIFKGATSGPYIIKGFTVFNKEIYISYFSGILLRVDIETGKTHEVFVQKDDSSYVFSELFTSGDRLFAVGTKTTMNNEQYNKIFELIIPGEMHFACTAKELNQ